MVFQVRRHKRQFLKKDALRPRLKKMSYAKTVAPTERDRVALSCAEHAKHGNVKVGTFEIRGLKARYEKKQQICPSIRTPRAS